MSYKKENRARVAWIECIEFKQNNFSWIEPFNDRSTFDSGIRSRHSIRGDAARIEGTDLFTNYRSIGSDDQTFGTFVWWAQQRAALVVDRRRVRLLYYGSVHRNVHQQRRAAGGVQFAVRHDVRLLYNLYTGIVEQILRVVLQRHRLALHARLQQRGAVAVRGAVRTVRRGRGAARRAATVRWGRAIWGSVVCTTYNQTLATIACVCCLLSRFIVTIFQLTSTF